MLDEAWHISATANRASIEQRGLLVPESGTRCVWMFSDLEVAERYMPLSWGCSYGDNDLWRVDVTGLALEPDPHPFAMRMHSVVSFEAIEVSRLRVINTHVLA